MQTSRVLIALGHESNPVPPILLSGKLRAIGSLLAIRLVVGSLSLARLPVINFRRVAIFHIPSRLHFGLRASLEESSSEILANDAMAVCV